MKIRKETTTLDSTHDPIFMYFIDLLIIGGIEEVKAVQVVKRAAENDYAQ